MGFNVSKEISLPVSEDSDEMAIADIDYKMKIRVSMFSDTTTGYNVITFKNLENKLLSNPDFVEVMTKLTHGTDYVLATTFAVNQDFAAFEDDGHTGVDEETEEKARN